VAPSFVEGYLRRGELVQLLPAFTSTPVKVYVLTSARRLLPAKVRVLPEAAGSVGD